MDTREKKFFGTGEIERANAITAGRLSHFFWAHPGWGGGLPRVGGRYMVPAEQVESLLIELRRRGIVREVRHGN